MNKNCFFEPAGNLPQIYCEHHFEHLNPNLKTPTMRIKPFHISESASSFAFTSFVKNEYLNIHNLFTQNCKIWQQEMLTANSKMTLTLYQVQQKGYL